MSQKKETWDKLLNRLDELNQGSGAGERTLDEMLDELPKLVDDLPLYSNNPTDKPVLVHYTSWERALSILRTKKPKMRMYHYELANDP